MPKYRLKRRFWDGSLLHPVGTVMEFEEGKAPSTAVEVKKGEKPAEPVEEEKPAEEPELDDGPSVIDAQAGDTLSGLSKKKGK